MITKRKIFTLILSLALSVCCAFAFTACKNGNEDSTLDPATENPVTEEKWNQALADESLNNVTVVVEGDIIFGNSIDKIKNTLKLAGDKMGANVVSNGEEILDTVFTGEEMTEIKNGILSIYFALLKEYDNYEYDSTLNNYKLSKQVNVEFDDSGEHVALQLESNVVTFSDDGRLLSFKFKYTQVKDFDSCEAIARVDCTLTFSDYGTTVVE